MKAIELLQYLKDGMDVGYPPKHIINNAIKEIEELEASNKELEALENRSCENCKHQREEFFHCNHENCRYLTHPICSRAYKDYWEAKQ